MRIPSCLALDKPFFNIAWRVGGDRTQMHSHNSTPACTLLCKYAIQSSTLKVISSVQYRSDQGGTRYYTMRVVAEPATTPPLWTRYLVHRLNPISCENKIPSSLRNRKNQAIGSNSDPTPTPSATAAHGTQSPSPNQTRYSSTDAR